MALDVTPGCAGLALAADAAAGGDDSFAGVSDAELLGVLCAWDRVEAHAAARKLAAIAEVYRRRPQPGSPLGPGRMPAACDEFAARELGSALAESRAWAEELLDVACQLETRLPGTRAALRDGTITPRKADIILRATLFLDEQEARAAEGKVLGRAGRLTPGGLRPAIARAVMEVAPEKARKRRGSRPGRPGGAVGRRLRSCGADGTPRVPGRGAADPPPAATSTTTRRTRQAEERACVMAARSVDTTTGSSRTAGGRRISSPTARSAGRRHPAGPTPPRLPNTRSDRRGDSQRRITALRFAASRWWGGVVITGPGDDTAAAEGRGEGHLRASHADRESVIRTLKAAFVQGRLTEDEFGARVDQVYASRTYAELAEVTDDIPAELTGARPPRDPWRATKVAWGVVYALILPGLITLVALPGGPAPTTVREVVTYFAIVYAVFWVLGVSVMVASRLGKPSGGPPPPRSAPGAGR